MTENFADVADAGVSFLNELLEHLHIEAEAQAGEAREDVQVFTFVGEVQRLLQEPSLATAIAVLTSQAVSRRVGRRVRCNLDVDGRLGEREVLLGVAALDVARSVRRSGRRGVIDGLNAAERRVVHTALAEEAGVSTRSQGEGDHRWICIERDAESQ